MDEGGEGEVVEVLTNRRAPLRLGYVMVKNRSQRDVDQGVKLQQVTLPRRDTACCAEDGFGRRRRSHDPWCVCVSKGREDEAAFFAEHPQLHALPPHLLGTANLMDRLTRLLVTRIETALPGIRWELQNQLDTVRHRHLKNSSLDRRLVDQCGSREWIAVLVCVQVERELIPLGKALPLTATERQHGLMKIVSDYCRVIRQAVRGDYRDPVRRPATRRAEQWR